MKRNSLFVVVAILLNAALAKGTESELILTLKAELSEESTVEEKLRIYNDLAWEYHSMNFDSANHYTELALTLAKAEENIYWQAVSLEMKAILMEISGNWDSALKLYLEVIPLRNQLGGEGLENTFNNMAIIFRLQDNGLKALDYFEKSYELEVKNGNKAGMAGSLNNIAITRKNLGIRDSVAELLQESLKLAKEVNSDRLALHSLINLGGWYFEENLNDSALTYFVESIKLAGQIGDSSSVCVSRIGVADIYRIEGKYEPSEDEYKIALEMAISLNNADYQTRVYRNLAELYKAKNEPNKAYEQLEKYLLLREELLNEELVRTTNELEQKYESARKEQEITQLELAAIAQNLEAAKSQNQKRLLFLLAILLFGILGFVTYRFVNQQKVARILRTKNATIAEALSERELLLREIHHRVKNNLQVVSSLLSIQGREIKDEKAKNAISESRNRVHSMALIHQYLYSDKELTSINMGEYIPNLCKKLFNAYKLDHDLIDLRIDVEPISLDVDTAIPLGIIINELITNSLKYAFEADDEGSIEVHFAERQNQLILRVNDNGKGKCDKERSDISFGMKLIRAFEEKLDAKIEILEKDGYEVICTIGKYKRHWLKNTAS
jgi:two-component sensor histidine kinase